LRHKSSMIFLVILGSFALKVTECTTPSQELIKNIESEENRCIKDGNYKEAIVYLQLELFLTQYGGPIERFIKCNKWLGIMHWNLGDIEKAKKFFSKVSILQSTINIFIKEIYFCRDALQVIEFYQKAKYARSNNNIAESNRLFKSAVLIAKYCNSRDLEVKCLRQLSANYWEQIRYKEYLQICTEALSLSIASRNRKEAGICCNNLGLYYWNNSSFSKALFLIEEGYRLSKHEEADENASICLSNLAVMYFELGDNQKALKCLWEVLKADVFANDEQAIAIDMNNLGLLYKSEYLSHGRLEDAEKSISAFYKALSINTISLKMKVLNNLGQIFLALKQVGLALPLFNESIRLAKCNSWKESELSAMNNLAFCYLEKKMFLKAQEAFNKVIIYSSSQKNTRYLWETYYGLGLCAEKVNQFDSALSYYKKSICIVDKLRDDISFDLQKVSFIKDKTIVYERINHLLYKKYLNSGNDEDVEELFYYIEKTKMKAFVESIIRNRLKGFFTKENSRKSMNTIMDNRNNIVGLKNDIDSLFQIIDNYSDNISQPFKNYEFNVSISEILTYTINYKTDILEYYTKKNESLIFKIHLGKIHMFLLPDEEAINKYVSGYIKFISSNNLPESSEYIASNRLYKILIAPYLEIDNEKKLNLIIIPDGCLCYLPFEALISGGSTRYPEYLIKRMSISYEPSASIAVILKSCTNIVNTDRIELIAFGDPIYSYNKRRSFNEIDISENEGSLLPELPLSNKEVKIAKRYFRKNMRNIFVREDANKSNVYKISGIKASILHFACHCIIDNANPDNTRLILSRKENIAFDDILKATEIYELKFPVGLVILSACQTAQGIIDDWEGVLGFSRVFIISGASAVISTLWKINEEAALLFMRKYYSYMFGGMNIGDSLRATKIAMLNTKYYRSKYWSAFVLYGEQSQVFEK
jgi:CHAT domain-containing protein/Tfp pilus assembly protein PilF